MPIRFLNESIGQTGIEGKSFRELGDVSAQEISNIPLSKPEEFSGSEEKRQRLMDAISSAEKFESSILGKALGVPTKLLGQPTTSQMLKRELESIGMPAKRRLMKGVSEVVGDVARAVPAIVPVGRGAAATKTLAQKVSNIVLQSLKSGAVTGAAKGVETLAEGEGVKEAGKKAAESGALTAGLTAAIPVLGKGTKVAFKNLTKAFSNVKPYALETAIKNPNVLSGNVPKVLDAGINTKEFLDDYAGLVKDQFEDRLNQLAIPSGKAVDSSKVKSLINKFNLDKNIVKSKIVNAAAREGIEITDDLANRFVNGKNIGFQEARKINSVLFDITKSGKTEQIGGGLLKKLSGIKSSLLDSMEKSVPEIKEANKFFAENASKIQKLDKIFGKAEDKESAIRSIAQQLSGVSKSKTGIARTLESIPGSEGIIKDLVESVAAEEFDKIGAPSLMKMIGAGGLGGFMGGAPGAMAAAAGQMTFGSPKAVKMGIQAAPTVKPLLRGAAETGARLAGREFNR